MRDDGTWLALGAAVLLAGVGAVRGRRGSAIMQAPFMQSPSSRGPALRGPLGPPEQSFVMFKPLAIRKGLVPKLKRELEQVGVFFEACVPVDVTARMMGQHYAQHRGKGFFPKLTGYYEGQTVLACRVSGPAGLVSRIRSLLGPSDPLNAVPGVHLRAYAIPYARSGETQGVDNLVHASDSVAAAQRQLKLWGLAPVQALAAK